MTSRSVFWKIACTLLALTPAITALRAEDLGNTPEILDGSSYGRAKAEEQSQDNGIDEQGNGESELTGIPALFSTPETGVGGGGAVVYLGPKLKSRRDFGLAGLTITERRQFMAAGVLELFDSQELFSVEGFFKITKYPDFFFGVGNDTKADDEDLYTMRSRDFGLNFKISPLSAPKHQFGIGFHQEITEFDEFNPDGILETRNYDGKYGGLSREITSSWQYQDNDEDFDPHRGIRIAWDLYKSSKQLGGNFESIRFWSNNDYFVPLTDKSTLAMQVYGQFSDGNVPWYQLAQSGGTNLLRGYFMGRFRDKQMLLSQAEWRRHLFRRWGVVAFAGIGQVASDVPKLFESKPLAAWGAGIRLRLTKQQRINARLDVGFNRTDPKTPSLYLYILEAF